MLVSCPALNLLNTAVRPANPQLDALTELVNFPDQNEICPEFPLADPPPAATPGPASAASEPVEPSEPAAAPPPAPTLDPEMLTDPGALVAPEELPLP